MEELREYNQSSCYSPEDIAEKLIEISDVGNHKGLKEDLENALYQLKAIAENHYNFDFYRTFYNVLLAVTENC